MATRLAASALGKQERTNNNFTDPPRTTLGTGLARTLALTQVHQKEKKVFVIARDDTSPPLQDFCKGEGEGAHRGVEREGWAQGTGGLSRIGYALGGTRARLGLLLVLPSGSSLLGH